MSEQAIRRAQRRGGEEEGLALCDVICVCGMINWCSSMRLNSIKRQHSRLAPALALYLHLCLSLCLSLCPSISLSLPCCLSTPTAVRNFTHRSLWQGTGSAPAAHLLPADKTFDEPKPSHHSLPQPQPTSTSTATATATATAMPPSNVNCANFN